MNIEDNVLEIFPYLDTLSEQHGQDATWIALEYLIHKLLLTGHTPQQVLEHAQLTVAAFQQVDATF
jgi:hypothetical protein